MARVSDWVKVGSAPNETSAVLMEGVLKDAGIPVLIRRGYGFDIPDFLSAGPRDALVPETGPGQWASWVNFSCDVFSELRL